MMVVKEFADSIIHSITEAIAVHVNTTVSPGHVGGSQFLSTIRLCPDTPATSGEIYN
jgi:hypothetical protein